MFDFFSYLYMTMKTCVFVVFKCSQHTQNLELLELAPLGPLSLLGLMLKLVETGLTEVFPVISQN